MFAEKDRYRLERNKAWQAEPALVEALCMLFYEFDPAGLWSGENPAARTEYLLEVTELIEGMPRAGDANQVSALVRDICIKFFGDSLCFEDWDGLGGAIWQAIQEHRK